MELPDRISTIIKVNQHTPASFADVLGVQRSSVSHVLNGRNKPSMDFIQKIIEHFPRVDASWLITGKQAGEIQDQNEKPLARKSERVQKFSEDDLMKQVLHKNDRLTKDSSLKAIEKIVVFYTDRTFDVYEQKHQA